MKRKNKSKLLLSAVLGVSMMLTACGGGGAGSEAGSGDSGEPTPASEEVVLKMVLLGGKPVDYDTVFNELNQKLKEKVNTTLEVEFLDWSDWTQKYPLKFAANEDFDLVYTANWAFYNDQAVKGGFKEITEDMLKEYAPQTWKQMPQVAWDQAKVNGKLYMVPNNNLEVTNKVVLYREDLRQKHNIPDINSMETYANYLKTIAENEPGMNAFGAKAADGWRWHELDQIALEQNNDFKVNDLRVPLVYKLDDATGQVFNVYETPEYRELLDYYKDLADNGAWSKNVVTNKNDVWQDMKADKVSSYAHNLGTTAFNLAEARRDLPNQEYAIADITPDSKKLSAISTQNGIAIHSTSKHTERALMVLDLLQNDREIHDLSMYGIAGTHYNPEGDDKFTTGPSATNYTGFSNWGWNSPLNRQDAVYPTEADDIFNGWQEEVYNYPLETFVFDDSAVKTEVANISNIMVRYAIPLVYGLVPDLDQGLSQLNAQLDAAGIDKVQQEMQKQIDAFLANQS